MKRVAGSTILLVTAKRIARADFDGSLRACRSGLRAANSSPAEAVRAALALGGKTSEAVWVLSEDVWTQKVVLHAGQVTGLTADQLARALSFEVEPFSGIPVMEGATGFHRGSDSTFEVVEISRSDRDAIQRVVADAGGKLAGITHPGAAPLDDEALNVWFTGWLPRLQGRALPLITPPAPAPSANRFLYTAIALEIAALLLLFGIGGYQALQRSALTKRQLALTTAANELAAANRQLETSRKELARLDKEQAQRERVVNRRGSLLALLNGLAATRPEDVVVRAIQAEGPSTIVVSGLSIEAGAVDEMSIVLTQSLRASGWTAQPRHKTGRRALPSGGPWEFSLTLTHEEAARAQAIQLSQRTAE